MEWKKTIKAYQAYLMLEKGLANNTVEAYTRDIQKLADYCQRQIPPVIFRRPIFAGHFSPVSRAAPCRSRNIFSSPPPAATATPFPA